MVTVSQDANTSKTQAAERTFFRSTGLITPCIFHPVFWPVSWAMRQHAYMLHVRSFPQPTVMCVVFPQPLPGVRGSPSQPSTATLNSRPPCCSPAAPRFTPYSPDPVTTRNKPRWKLPLRTHPSSAAGACRAWAKAPTLQLPPARLLPQPLLKVDSLFSVTHRDSCAAVHMPKEVWWHSFQVSFWKRVFRRGQPSRYASIGGASCSAVRAGHRRETPLCSSSSTASAANTLKDFSAGPVL